MLLLLGDMLRLGSNCLTVLCLVRLLLLCCCCWRWSAAALPPLQPQVEGYGMPASLRASQLLWTVFEGWLALWLLQKTWLAWTVCALWQATTLGLAGPLQQVGSLVDAHQTTWDCQ